MKNKITFPLLIVASILSGCNSNVRENISISNFQKTYYVSTGNIASDNSYVGNLQSQDTTFLGFKLPGRITNIYVKEGNFVKKGQLLATLDGNEVKTQFASAKDMLASLWNMYKSTENMFDAQISSMKSKIAQAKTGMKGMKTGLGDTQKITKEQLATASKKVNQANIGLQTAESNLNNTKQVLQQKEQNIYSNSKNAIAQSKILLNNFLIFVDQVFGISNKNKHKNDAFESYLSAKNSALKEEIKKDWLILNSKYINWNKTVDILLLDIKNSNSVVTNKKLKQRIYNVLKQTKDLLVLSRKLADKSFTAIDSSVSSRNFPQSMINQYKQQISTYQNKIESALLTAQGNFLLGIKGSIQNIENFNKQSEMQINLLQKQYELAKAGYETAKQTYEQYKAISNGKVNEISTKYEVSKNQYKEALKGLEALKKQKAAQLSQIKSQINQVKGNKNLAAVNLGNIKLYSPYEGVITKKIGNIGQVVGAGTPILEIANYKKLKGVFYIPLEEIQKIKVGDKVIIKGIGKSTTGTISLIYPSINSISKKVQVEIKLDKVPKNWVLGMFITGYPINAEYTGLIIPYQTIKYQYGKPYVLVKKGEEFIKQNIILGHCNTNNCIIKSGLNLGNIIK